MTSDRVTQLKMFSGPVSEQVILLINLWRQRSKRTFVAMRERMNELEDLNLTPTAFDNYFRRAGRVKTPEEAVWALIRVMRDDSWLPKEQQCTLKEALYLAVLKDVSVVTYARIYQLFPGQEEDFRALSPLGDMIVEELNSTKTGVVFKRGEHSEGHQSESLRSVLGIGVAWIKRVGSVLLGLLLIAILLWTFISAFGWYPR